MPEEKILVVPRDAMIHSLGTYAFDSGFNRCADITLYGLLNKFMHYSSLQPRSEVEHDDKYVQIVVYPFLASGNKIFKYVRSKVVGDERLFSDHSIGTGGHVNSNDIIPALGMDSCFTGIMRAVYREMNEELPRNFLSNGHSTVFSGFISNFHHPVEVHRVHFGLVFEVSVPCLPDAAECPSLTLPAHLTLESLKEPEQFKALELWSQQIVSGMMLPRTTFFPPENTYLDRPKFEIKE